MSIIKFRAKVNLENEEDMEAQSTYDMGNIASSKNWVWRDISIPVSELYRLVSYNSSKTVAQMYDGEKMLIAEAFDSLHERWKSLLDEMDVGLKDDEEKEQESEEEHEDEDED